LAQGLALGLARALQQAWPEQGPVWLVLWQAWPGQVLVWLGLSLV